MQVDIYYGKSAARVLGNRHCGAKKQEHRRENAFHISSPFDYQFQPAGPSLVNTPDSHFERLQTGAFHPLAKIPDPDRQGIYSNKGLQAKSPPSRGIFQRPKPSGCEQLLFDFLKPNITSISGTPLKTGNIPSGIHLKAKLAKPFLFAHKIERICGSQIGMRMTKVLDN